MLGIRGKLFVTSLALLLAIGGATLLLLEMGLGGFLRARDVEELSARVAIARAIIEDGRRGDAYLNDDALAARLGQVLGGRVTILDRSGTVLGDSEHNRVGSAARSNYAQLPEVRVALERARGVAPVAPSTLPVPVERGGMLLLAEPFERGASKGVVRVGMSTEDVDKVLSRLRFFVLLTALAGVGVALLMSALASFWASRALVALVQNASTVATGGRTRLPVESRDELGSLAGSFNRMSERLERTVAQLAGERDRFEAILGHMAEAVIALDSDDCVELANPAALRLLEVPEVQRGQPVVDLVRAPAFAELLPRVRVEGNASTELSVGKTTARSVLARGALVEATSGMVIVMLDVTEMRRLEAVRRDFVANVSHELRTPISIMRANAETLLDGALTDTERGPGFAHAIVRSAERLGRIVSDLLDLSRIESDKIALQIRPLPIADILLRVVDSFQLQARGKAITLTQDAPEDLEALCDEGVLEQILTNLVDNALKYTPSGGNVHVCADSEGSRARIEVRDDGPGIETRHRQRIFERFYRVDPGRSRDMGGTGLGLSIVKHLVEALGGWRTCRTLPGTLAP
jgi:two-component system phosphate regulon sensor histidine kinase PhoR